jgi:tetratricopeptide (TPR) repeat protein
LKINEDNKDLKQINFCNNKIGLINFYQGQYEKAIEYFKKNLIIDIQLNSYQGYEASTDYSNIGLAYKELKNFKLAVENLENALKIRKELLPPGDSALAQIHVQLADIYKLLGDDFKSLEHLKAVPPNYNP